MNSGRMRKAVRSVGMALGLLLCVGWAVSLPVRAQRDDDRYRRYGGLSREGRRAAQDNGYRTGLDRGGDDGRSHSSYDPNRSEHYRDGDSGYHSEYGSKEAYRETYRAAFRRGYDQGYRRAAGRRRY